jgi:HEPN/Toprim N-terminal domain 1
MGSFSYITFADYPICENKNWYHEEIVNSLFQSSNFICEKRKCITRNKLIWGDIYNNAKGSFEFKGFKQTVKVCKQRLEIYGASYKSAKSDFNNAKKISQKENCYDFSLSGLTYENYLSEIKNIINSKEKRDSRNLDLNFKDALISGELGICGQSHCSHLYSILCVLPEHEIVEYDLTEILFGGWVKEQEVKHIDFEKIIVLAEGKTDVEFISKSIEKLYPYLIDYYHFIDFNEYKVESNASALVKLVISFAASNVKHPIIVLFDNDTAGLMEMKNLTTKSLPNNIKILRYPNISFAKNYPTKGPTGNKRMNVNGSACGIEMYLGLDVLTKDNELIPIQWKGFNEKEKKYQGEIEEKQLVQEKFRMKLKSETMNGVTEINILLNEIFNAYK